MGDAILNALNSHEIKTAGKCTPSLFVIYKLCSIPMRQVSSMDGIVSLFFQLFDETTRKMCID